MTGAAAAECPGPLTLFQYANGHLDPSQSDRITAHVQTCKRCAEKVQQTGDDGRSLADALEPREPMALETAEDVLRRLDLDLDFEADFVEVEAPKPRAPTPAPSGRLPQPAGLRVKGARSGGAPPPVRRPTPMAGPSLHAVPSPSAPPPRGFASPMAPPPRSFAAEKGGTTVGPAPSAPSAGPPPPPAPSSSRASAGPPLPPPPSGAPVRSPTSAPPPRPSSGAPPVPVVRSSNRDEGKVEPTPDVSRSRRWLFASIVLFTLLGVGAAGALILYPRLTGEELRWASVVGALGLGSGGDPAPTDSVPAPTDEAPKSDAAKKDADDGAAKQAADGGAASAADGAPADGAPADGAPADGAPADGAPADGAPADGAPADGALAEADTAPSPAPADAAPAPANAAPANAAPANAVPANAAPANANPADAPKDAAPDAPAPDAPTPDAAEAAPADDAAAAPSEAEGAPTPAEPADAKPLGRSISQYSEPIASRDPGEARDLARLGSLALRKSELVEAEAFFQRALAHDPRNSTALGGLASLHFTQGRHRTALKFAAKAVNAAPQDADLRILLGDAYLETLAYANARREYEKAAALGHRSAAARLGQLQERLASN